MRDREKLMVVPSRSVTSTFVGSCACSLGSAARKYELRPGRTWWTAWDLFRRLVTVAQFTLHTLSKTCSLFRNVWFSRCNP